VLCCGVFVLCLDKHKGEDLCGKRKKNKQKESKYHFTYLVSYSGAKALRTLVCNALGHTDGADTPWLSANDVLTSA
jgi:hypothetical protein